MQIISKDTLWYRSNKSMIGGVCAGISEKVGTDVNLVRLAWIACILFAGTGFLMYLILCICLPNEENLVESQQPMFLGVCSRINKWIKSDLGLIRTFCVLGAVMSFGTFVIFYVLTHFILSSQKQN